MNGPIPASDALLLPWLQNFCVKFPGQATALGFAAPEVAAVTADCNMLTYLLQTYVPTVKSDGNEAVRYKELIKNGPIGTPGGGPPAPAVLQPAPPLVAPGALVRLRAVVRIIKNKPAYQDTIGTDLGITTPEVVEDASPPRVAATLIQAGNVVLGWTKQGWTGVKVQGRAQGTAAWTDLGVDMFSPWADTRPLTTQNTPEVREYRMCHLEGDTPLMNWSDVVVVIVNP
jgi:hypothetical protein